MLSSSSSSPPLSTLLLLSLISLSSVSLHLQERFEPGEERPIEYAMEANDSIQHELSPELK